MNALDSDGKGVIHVEGCINGLGLNHSSLLLVMYPESSSLQLQQTYFVFVSNPLSILCMHFMMVLHLLTLRNVLYYPPISQQVTDWNWMLGACIVGIY